MSEGFTLTANVYRSKAAAAGGQPSPVIMCAHPYDNRKTPALGGTPLSGPPLQYRLIPQVGRPRMSTLTSWESPDPNFWVPSGYAVVNLNLPGYADAGGPPTVCSEHQAKCYYEAIEWVAAQPWCTGSVGLNGVSFLAISQYHVAACQAYGGPPPALKAISPWEGLSDMYRDIFRLGGVEEIGFPEFWWTTEVREALNGSVEDFVRAEGATPVDYGIEHPLLDAFWDEKAAKLQEITTPMLVCASFSDHGLHTTGSFRAYLDAASEHKWVYTHRTGKWDSYYSGEVQQLTKQFMDCFVKGETDNGMLARPPVRLEIRSSRDAVHSVRWEADWPPPEARLQKLYLDAASDQLAAENPTVAAERSYDAETGQLRLRHVFADDTELSGHLVLRLWVETRAAAPGGPAPDDMTLFAVLEKLDAAGRPVRFYGSVGNPADVLSKGCLLVSHRRIDQGRSTDWLPVLRHDRDEKLSPGQIVPVDIALYPIATFFAAGEGLELIIAGQEIARYGIWGKRAEPDGGTHVIHVGGAYESYLLAPVTPLG